MVICVAILIEPKHHQQLMRSSHHNHPSLNEQSVYLLEQAFNTAGANIEIESVSSDRLPPTRQADSASIKLGLSSQPQERALVLCIQTQ